MAPESISLFSSLATGGISLAGPLALITELLRCVISAAPKGGDEDGCESIYQVRLRWAGRCCIRCCSLRRRCRSSRKTGAIVLR